MNDRSDHHEGSIGDDNPAQSATTTRVENAGDARRGDHRTRKEGENVVRTHTPTSVSTPENQALTLRLNALLDDPTPDDWDDPTMLAWRVSKLERAACSAADAMIELLVRLRDERARDVHIREGGCVLTSTDAMFKLHRAMGDYQSTTLRQDGEKVTREAIEGVHGNGVAALTMRALAELRRLIVHEMQVLQWPSTPPGAPTNEGD
jgi:hypothetical protein